jgi:3-oxoacyl-[acyl-carrier-protein] synthase-3
VLHAAGLRPGAGVQTSPSHSIEERWPATTSWLTGTAVRLPAYYQSAEAINEALHRPAGWLQEHAGIRGRHLWGEEDPLAAAREAARQCLADAECSAEEVGALLVTSEAPPLLIGLAAALHDRLRLRTNSLALEIGAACTGFLAALRVAQALLPQTGCVLIVAVEAPSGLLTIKPGPAGEAAALFGDASAACVLCERPVGRAPVPLTDIWLGVDGGRGSLLRVERTEGTVEVAMDGVALASQAVRALSDAVQHVTQSRGIRIDQLLGVAAHCGNGRMADLLARQLSMPPERVWSETATTGNLGTASLPVAWAAHQPVEAGPVAWSAVGAGMTWGAALTGVDWH